MLHHTDSLFPTTYPHHTASLPETRRHRDNSVRASTIWPPAETKKQSHTLINTHHNGQDWSEPLLSSRHRPTIPRLKRTLTGSCLGCKGMATVSKAEPELSSFTRPAGPTENRLKVPPAQRPPRPYLRSCDRCYGNWYRLQTFPLLFVRLAGSISLELEQAARDLHCRCRILSSEIVRQKLGR